MNNELFVTIDTKKLEEKLAALSQQFAAFSEQIKAADAAVKGWLAAYNSLPWYTRAYIRLLSFLHSPITGKWPPRGSVVHHHHYADGGIIKPGKFYLVGEERNRGCL